MGAAGLIAALADRPRSRWYAVLLAAALTLAINPRADGDVGWQLSFAAVIGIMLWLGGWPRRSPADAERGSARRALAEAVAVTAAATVATAPLMAEAFDQFSPAALPANVLAAPAVAPAMWLGMLAGIAGQLPLLPVEPLNWLDSLCLAYIAQVAHWLAAPDWALLTVHLRSIWAVAAAYAVLLLGMELAASPACTAAKPSRRWPVRSAPRLSRRGDCRRGCSAAVAISRAPPPPPPATDLVGAASSTSGRAIRSCCSHRMAIRCSSTPGHREDGVEDRLRELGIETLAAIVISHDQSDHAGDLGELLGAVQVDRVVYGRDRSAPAQGGARGGRGALPAGGGRRARLGALRLSALWPPRELPGETGEDPNLLCLVLVARWRHFSMLLTGDAEAESVPIDPGPVDVLKVAHHGSEDAGLGRAPRALRPEARGDLGGRRQPLRPSDARRTLSELARARRARPCAPTARARSTSRRRFPAGRWVRRRVSLWRMMVVLQTGGGPAGVIVLVARAGRCARGREEEAPKKKGHAWGSQVTLTHPAETRSPASSARASPAAAGARLVNVFYTDPNTRPDLAALRAAHGQQGPLRGDLTAARLPGHLPGPGRRAEIRARKAPADLPGADQRTIFGSSAASTPRHRRHRP